MKRVTGLGGVFFKADNPEKMQSWYAEHLGISGVFKWRELESPETTPPAQTIWSPFKKDTTYFAPSEKSFMINYRVENLAGLIAKLKEEGVTVIGEIAEYDYGKFGWILDPEGNKIELWEPID